MNKTIIVSICCLTYNHEPYIRKCLDGFIMQKTNFPFEVLIHDDASTDRTADIIREYEAKYPDIIKPIYQTENKYSKGIGITKTYQFPRAKGKYIAMCEGDDYWTDPLKLQKQVDFLEANPDCVLTGHDAEIIDENNKIINESKLPEEYKRNASSDELMKTFWVLTLSMLFRNVKELFNNYPEEAIGVQNGDTFLISMLGNNGNYHYMPEITPARYRVHIGGIWSMQSVINKVKMQIKTLTQLEKYYKKIKNKEIECHFTIKRKERINRYLTLSFQDKNKIEFFKAYKLYFKEFKAYKNIKEFIYLHKVLGKFILGVNHKVLERNTIQK